MPVKIQSGSTVGIEGVQVEIEADITAGLPTFIIVGLPDTAVQEARERVKSAVKNTGFSFPRGRVAVNLAPADLPKTGSIYDLPIAISILLEGGLIKTDPGIINNSIFLGELALDGRLRSINGVLPIALMAARNKIENIFLPTENANEAAMVKEIKVWPAQTLFDLVAHLEGRVTLKEVERGATDHQLRPHTDGVDLADVSGQNAAKRALVIAAAGHHNILFTGPPGSGKTMLAKALRSIMAPLSEYEILEVTKIYSIAGLLPNKTTAMTRPFRSPHHTSSRIALVGGGSIPKPGEVTLAHRGVLFLDEIPEFPRSTLESLRQPLEDGVVTVSRASGSFQFPAQFILVAAQNPCPCGNLGNPGSICQCSDTQITRYRNRISGPLLDRIDLVMEVPRQLYSQLKNKDGMTSQQAREKINQTKDIQQQRYGDGRTNARLTSAEIKIHCSIDGEAEKLLGIAVDKLRLSARAYHRTLKVARTIADLEGEELINQAHVSEALQYRPKHE